MIKGIVKSCAARIKLWVRGADSQRRVEAVIDTGFNGWLTLPAETIASPKLPLKTIAEDTLADGRVELFEVYTALIIWDDEIRRIAVHKSGSAALVGMALLKGYELNVQVRSRGEVRIERLND
jgi:clan AA aspartic protease